MPVPRARHSSILILRDAGTIETGGHNTYMIIQIQGQTFDCLIYVYFSAR